MPTIEILHRATNAVLYAAEAATQRDAVLAALAAGVDLGDAVLTGVDLAGARLAGAPLARIDGRGADLRGADLAGANLRGAALSRAVLAGATLSRAGLRSAYLAGADLRGADLRGADLTGVGLFRADLRGATFAGACVRSVRWGEIDFRGADLGPVRDDVFAVLDAAPAEVPGLRDALVAGRIDGSAYRGRCACLVGTLARLRGCEPDDLPGLAPDVGRPAEGWFLRIRPGDTPATSPAARQALAWVDEWLAEHAAAPPA